MCTWISENWILIAWKIRYLQLVLPDILYKEIPMASGSVMENGVSRGIRFPIAKMLGMYTFIVLWELQRIRMTGLQLKLQHSPYPLPFGDVFVYMHVPSPSTVGINQSILTQEIGSR